MSDSKVSWSVSMRGSSYGFPVWNYVQSFDVEAEARELIRQALEEGEPEMRIQKVITYQAEVVKS